MRELIGSQNTEYVKPKRKGNMMFNNKNKAEKASSKLAQNKKVDGLINKDETFPENVKKDISREQSNMQSEGGRKS